MCVFLATCVLYLCVLACPSGINITIQYTKVERVPTKVKTHKTAVDMRILRAGEMGRENPVACALHMEPASTYMYSTARTWVLAGLSVM